MQVYERQGVKLVCGDCLEFLPTLEADVLITDPPYGIRNEFGEQNRLDGRRKLQFDWDALGTNKNVFQALSIAGRGVRSFFTFCGASQVSHIEEQLSEWFTVKPACWVKACPPPAMPGNWWPSGFEFALYGYRSGAHFHSDDTKRRNVFYSDTYRYGIRADEKVAHPTQKWLPLIVEVVEAMTVEGETILDPFTGSGTTAIACIRTGRRFVGCEIEPRYFDIACKRIDRELDQLTLFPPAPKPVAENQHTIFAKGGE